MGSGRSGRTPFFCLYASLTVVGRTPWSAADALVGLFGFTIESTFGQKPRRPTRASAADQGVRPTKASDILREWQPVPGGIIEQRPVTVGMAERVRPSLLPALDLLPFAPPAASTSLPGLLAIPLPETRRIGPLARVHIQTTRPVVLPHDRLACADPKDAASGTRLCRHGISLHLHQSTPRAGV